MTTAAISLSGSGSLLTHGTPGVGPDHQRLWVLLQETVERLVESVSLGDSLQKTYRKLYEVFEECGRSDWDALGCLRSSASSFRVLRKRKALRPLIAVFVFIA